MKNIGYWKITLDDATEKVGTDSNIESGKFSFKANFDNNRLELTFIGMLDTLTSPEVLAFFQDLAGKHEINDVVIDCEKLDYISSAGLRVLMIMHKSSKKGVTLKKITPLVNEIIGQTGFDSILKIAN